MAGRRAQIEQLEYVREVCQSPRLTLQVIPYGAGGHAAPTGFSILRFTERDLPDVVYIEQLTSATFLDQRPDVEHYLEVVDELSGAALTPGASAGFIEQLARQI